MPSGICIAPCLVQCNSQVLHVVHMMLYHLAYCKSLILYLVGIVECIFNQTPHIYIYLCMLIGGDGVLVFGVDLGLLLIYGELCPTVEGWSLHHHCKLQLWSGSWKYIFISMHCWICGYLGGINGIWYPWLSWTFRTPLIICCPWYGTLGWLHIFLNLF